MILYMLRFSLIAALYLPSSKCKPFETRLDQSPDRVVGTGGLGGSRGGFIRYTGSLRLSRKALRSAMSCSFRCSGRSIGEVFGNIGSLFCSLVVARTWNIPLLYAVSSPSS